MKPLTLYPRQKGRLATMQSNVSKTVPVISNVTSYVACCVRDYTTHRVECKLMFNKFLTWLKDSISMFLWVLICPTKQNCQDTPMRYSHELSLRTCSRLIGEAQQIRPTVLLQERRACSKAKFQYALQNRAVNILLLYIFLVAEKLIKPKALKSFCSTSPADATANSFIAFTSVFPADNRGIFF